MLRQVLWPEREVSRRLNALWTTAPAPVISAVRFLVIAFPPISGSQYGSMHVLCVHLARINMLREWICHITEMQCMNRGATLPIHPSDMIADP